MVDRYEYCARCYEKTGRAGRAEDSIFLIVNDEEYGPLCEEITQAIDRWWRCSDSQENKMDYQRRKAGQELLDAAYRFWKSCQKEGQ